MYYPKEDGNIIIIQNLDTILKYRYGELRYAYIIEI